MDNAAWTIAEFLNQPVKIWMVISVFAVARLLMLLASMVRAQANEKTTEEGMNRRRNARPEDAEKKVIYNPKPLRRKNREMN